MLQTRLTQALGIRFPLIGAPMVGAGTGRLAHAITQAGGLGMLAWDGRAQADVVTQVVADARGPEGLPFGIGLMLWTLPARPDLVELAEELRPSLVSLSFGPIEPPLVERFHRRGILVAAQVSELAAGRAAEASGVDIVVAQGTEAGGHTGSVATLPLLQLLVRNLDVPVLAAGGIASPEGVAAALAGGAQGVWVGTAFLGSVEAAVSPAARNRLLAASERDTVHTHLFDRLLHVDWPEEWPGRALRNRLTDAWRAEEEALPPTVREMFERGRAAEDYDVTFIYAGQAVGLLEQVRPAGEIVRYLMEGAEAQLKRVLREVLVP